MTNLATVGFNLRLISPTGTTFLALNKKKRFIAASLLYGCGLLYKRVPNAPSDCKNLKQLPLNPQQKNLN